MIKLTTLLPVWIRSLKGDKTCESLHSVDQMHAILESERLRCDRGRSRFALLTFTLPKRCDPQHVANLTRIICERIRVTDRAGLMGPQRIGVVLPETPATGAWKLAEDICELLPVKMRRPECDVYVYPFDPANPLDTNSDASQPRAHGEAEPMQVLFARSLPMWKRAIDVVGAGMALTIAAPFLLLVALAVKVTSRGPVFYIQQREGLGGRSFWLYKFRSMIVDADAMKDELRSSSEQDGPAFKLRNDPRVTPIGRWLRRTCIDELPQLFNVLRGDMSLVGPRPLPCDESRRCDPWQRRRLDVTPGLTCVWQVYGGTKVMFTEWMRMDLRYADARSLSKDLRLMALTIPSVINRDGVY